MIKMKLKGIVNGDSEWRWFSAFPSPKESWLRKKLIKNENGNVMYWTARAYILIIKWEMIIVKRNWKFEAQLKILIDW